jgi:hypothetical protein
MQRCSYHRPRSRITRSSLCALHQPRLMEGGSLQGALENAANQRARRHDVAASPFRMQRWSCPSDTPIVPTRDNFPDKPVIILKTVSEAMSAQRRRRPDAAEKHIFRRHVLPSAGPLPSDPSSLEHALPKKRKSRRSSNFDFWCWS